MLIAARTGAWSKIGGGLPTARDYVQDGLIAMWDGIENAGWGVHDSNATAWKDLIGGTVGDLDVFGANIGENAVRLNGVSAAKETNYNSNEMSVEIIADVSRLERPGACIWWKQDVSVAGLLGWWKNNIYCNQFYFPWWDHVNLSNNEVNGVNSFQASIANREQNIYTNGVQVGHGASDVTRKTLAKFHLNMWNNSNVSDISYLSIRIYGRALTTDELSNNREIDKARFNLS